MISNATRSAPACAGNYSAIEKKEDNLLDNSDAVS